MNVSSAAENARLYSNMAVVTKIRYVHMMMNISSYILDLMFTSQKFQSVAIIMYSFVIKLDTKLASNKNRMN